MRPALVYLAVVGCLLAGTARADDPDAPLVAEGIQLRREQRDAEALERFRRAYQLRPAPKTRVQIALAEEATGDWILAEKDLLEALSHDDPWIAERSEALKGSLAEIQAHLASLKIETNVIGAELWLSGALAGKVSSAPVRVTSGDLEIEIRAHGYRSSHRSVRVPAQSIMDLVIDLNPLAAPSTPLASRAVVAAPSTSIVPITWAWVTLGLAGGALSTGVVGHVEHDLNATHHNAGCIGNGRSADPICTGYVDRANTFETVAIAGYDGAGLLGGASALLFVLASRKTPRDHLDVTVVPSGGTATLRTTF